MYNNLVTNLLLAAGAAFSFNIGAAETSLAQTAMVNSKSDIIDYGAQAKALSANTNKPALRMRRPGDML